MYRPALEMTSVVIWRQIGNKTKWTWPSRGRRCRSGWGFTSFHVVDGDWHIDKVCSGTDGPADITISPHVPMPEVSPRAHRLNANSGASCSTTSLLCVLINHSLSHHPDNSNTVPFQLLRFAPTWFYMRPAPTAWRTSNRVLSKHIAGHQGWGGATGWGEHVYPECYLGKWRWKRRWSPRWRWWPCWCPARTWRWAASLLSTWLSARSGCDSQTLMSPRRPAAAASLARGPGSLIWCEGACVFLESCS